MRMTEENPKPKQNRNKPATNLTLSPRVKAASKVYRKDTGKSLSTLANELLQDFLEKKGYIKSRKPWYPILSSRYRFRLLQGARYRCRDLHGTRSNELSKRIIIVSA